jgi:uncharacterized membrane protein
MGSTESEGAAHPQPGEVDYESTPLSRQEYITAIVHLYRGELSRATSWRIRLDNTTNWAVLTTAALLSLAFGSEGTHSHVVLLIGMMIIAVFWAFESRRYRFADIWYSRVRKIEENFYGPILRRDPTSPEESWGLLVAEDMFHPAFKITKLEALRARFLRNYWAIYLVILAAWVLKLAIGTEQVGDVRERLTIGPLPWWSPLAFIGVLLVAVLILLTATRQSEVFEESDHWKISP